MGSEHLMNPLRILLVEDDPVSQAFLTAAMEALPAVVDRAASLADARMLAATHPYALWLVDANLPDGRGADLLRQLRTRDPATPALAHTASNDRHELDALIDAGFLEVLVKPLSAQALHAAIRRCLGSGAGSDLGSPASCGKLPLWDDAAALSALNGRHEHVQALRRLFLDELPMQCQAITAAVAADDAAGARAILHRLRASCGFVGAVRLDAIVREMEGDPCRTSSLRRLDEAVADLLSA
jgi:DNA-binding response OmpR family regulator